MKHFEELETFIKTNSNWLSVLKPYLKSVNVCDYSPDWVCLMYNLFDIPKDPELFNIIKQCRGVVVNKYTGEIICAPFIKFWNYGETYADEIDWSTAEVSKKRDGWLIKAFKNKGHLYIMTNGMFLSSNVKSAPIMKSIAEGKYDTITDVIKEAFTNADNTCTFSNTGGLEIFSEWSKEIPNGSTIMLELESEANVIHTTLQKEPKLWLIGFRDSNGNELTKFQAKEKYKLPFEIPEILDFKDIVSLTSTLNNWTIDKEGEGVVVCDSNFNRIKIKCNDYLRVKYISEISNISDSKLFQIILNNEEDDLLALQPSLIERVHYIKGKIKEYNEYCFSIYKKVIDMLESVSSNKKDFVELVKDKPNKSLYLSFISTDVEKFLTTKYNFWKTKKNGLADLLEVLENE